MTGIGRETLEWIWTGKCATPPNAFIFFFELNFFNTTEKHDISDGMLVTEFQSLIGLATEIPSPIPSQTHLRQISDGNYSVSKNLVTNSLFVTES